MGNEARAGAGAESHSPNNGLQMWGIEIPSQWVLLFLPTTYRVEVVTAPVEISFTSEEMLQLEQEIDLLEQITVIYLDML